MSRVGRYLPMLPAHVDRPGGRSGAGRAGGPGRPPQWGPPAGRGAGASGLVPGAEEHLGGEARAERQDQAGGSLRRAALIEGAAQHVEHHHAGDVADLAEALPRQVQPLGPQDRWPAGVAEHELQVARLDAVLAEEALDHGDDPGARWRGPWGWWRSGS